MPQFCFTVIKKETKNNIFTVSVAQVPNQNMLQIINKVPNQIDGY